MGLLVLKAAWVREPVLPFNYRSSPPIRWRLSMLNQPFRVLIVEDYKEERETFKDILSTLHCVFSEAENYEQAYEKIKTQEFDVVILDIGLPGTSGLQLIRQAMKEGLPLAPVIIITGEA